MLVGLVLGLAGGTALGWTLARQHLGVSPLPVAEQTKTALPEEDRVPEHESDPVFQGRPASAWVKGLSDRDHETQIQAQRSLLLIGDAGVPQVEKSYRTGDLTGRMAASSVLVLLVRLSQSRPALAALVRAAKSSDNFTRLQAVVNLGSCGPAAEGALAVLEKISSDDPEPGMRDQAKKSMAKIKAVH
jgi:hypothetical protein